MALSSVEIVKLLPRIDCQECEYPTCLAFAIKLAEKQAPLDLCQRLTEEAKRILSKECISNSDILEE